MRQHAWLCSLTIDAIARAVVFLLQSHFLQTNAACFFEKVFVADVSMVTIHVAAGDVGCLEALRKPEILMQAFSMASLKEQLGNRAPDKTFEILSATGTIVGTVCQWLWSGHVGTVSSMNTQDALLEESSFDKCIKEGHIVTRMLDLLLKRDEDLDP